MRYAKTLIAGAGSAATAALATVPPHTRLWDALTIVSAVLTFYGVYRIPNIPSPAAGAD